MPDAMSIMYNDFSGGTNNTVEGHLIKDNEFQDCMNIIMGTGVAFQKLEGYVLYGNDLGAGKITGMLNYIKQNEDAFFLITEGTNWRQYNTGTWDSIYSSFSDGKLICQIVYKDLAIACDGVTATKKYDGATVANLTGSPPISKFITIHQNRAFAMGNPTHRNRVYFSALGDPETWGANDFIDIRTDDGDYLTGEHEFYNRLYQFKQNSIWKMKCLGDPITDWEVENVNDNVGCVSHYTIKPVLNDLYFLTKNIGVQSLSTIPFRTSDSVGISLLSKKIKKWIEDFTVSELANSVACNHDGKYFLGITMGAGRRTLICDYIKKSWVISDMPIQQFLIKDGIMYLGRSDIANVNKFGGVYHREEGLNLNQNPSIEVDTSGYNDLAGATISRDTIEHYSGIASLKCITDNIYGFEGWERNVTLESEAGTTYTFSLYLKGSGTVKMTFYDNGGGGDQHGSVITLTSTWTRYSMTATFGANSTMRVLEVRTNTQQGITFYSDVIMHRKIFAYDSWILTKSYGFPDLSYKKRYRKYELFIKESGDWNIDILMEVLPSGQTLNHEISMVGVGVPLGTFMLGTDKLGAGLYAFKKEWINLRGNSISFRIGNNNIDEWYECNGINLFMIPETRYIKTKHYKIEKEGGGD